MKFTGKCHRPKPRPTLWASLRSRNACQDFTRATLYGNLQEKYRHPESAPWSSTGLYTYRKKNGLISVWGKNGLISADQRIVNSGNDSSQEYSADAAGRVGLDLVYMSSSIHFKTIFGIKWDQHGMTASCPESNFVASCALLDGPGSASAPDISRSKSLTLVILCRLKSWQRERSN